MKAGPLRGAARTYLTSDPLPEWRAAAFLRSVFVVMFAGQVLVALLVGVAVSALAPGRAAPNDLLGWVLVAFAFMQVPLAVGVASRLGSVGSRRAVLSRVLLAAVVLAGTAWFAALAAATGQRGLSVYILVALVVGAYGLGFLTVSRLARAATSLPPEKRGSTQPS